MDNELNELLKLEPGAKHAVEKDIRVLDGRAGAIEFDGPNGVVKYTLKPLADLYGEGRGFSSADPLNPPYEHLFSCIENSILTYYYSDGGLSDGIVSLTLDRMGVNPACDPRNDELCRCIQFDLRLMLSLENYSKQEVRQAFRVISKSVNRHTKAAGITGYLEFISRQFGG